MGLVSHPFVNVEDMLASWTMMLHIVTGIKAEWDTAAKEAPVGGNGNWILLDFMQLWLFVFE